MKADCVVNLELLNILAVLPGSESVLTVLAFGPIALEVSNDLSTVSLLIVKITSYWQRGRTFSSMSRLF